MVPPSLSVPADVLLLVCCVPELRFPPAFVNLPSSVGVGVQTLARGETGLHGGLWQPLSVVSGENPVRLWSLVAA